MLPGPHHGSQRQPLPLDGPAYVEDFILNVPEERFHINPDVALWLSGPLFALPAMGLALAAGTRSVWGSRLLGLAGFGWFVAATLDHGIALVDQPFRDEPSSSIWVVGMMLNGLALAWASLRIEFCRRRLRSDVKQPLEKTNV